MQIKKTIEQEDIKEILKVKGLGWSTLSKLLYFLKLKVNGKQALILDKKVIYAKSRFEDKELIPLHLIKYPPKTPDYFKYVDAMGRLSSRIKIEPDKIEMFLYQFGGNVTIHPDKDKLSGRKEITTIEVKE